MKAIKKILQDGKMYERLNVSFHDFSVHFELNNVQERVTLLQKLAEKKELASLSPDKIASR